MTNPVLQAIADRYSCRSYTDTPVSREDLEKLALAAVQAPSANGAAPWYLAVVTNRALIDEIHDAALEGLRAVKPDSYERAIARGGDLFHNGQALIVVATRPGGGTTSTELDAGLLIENVVVAAHSLGLGTLINGLSALAFRDKESGTAQRLTKALGIPEGFEMTISIVVGHPDKTRAPHVPDLSAVRYID